MYNKEKTFNKEMRQFPIVYTGPIGRTAFGWGAHTTVADECKAAGMKKALITTTGLKGTGIIDEIKGIMEYNGVPVEVYDKVTSNPKDFQVMEAYEVYKQGGCDGVVSVGGGSSHDCGKGVRLVATNDGKDVHEFIRGWTPRGTGLSQDKPVTIPQVSVNTTAGTSAENNRHSSIMDTNLRRKMAGITPEGLAPFVALIDPLLVRCVPQHIAAWTGWDAFAHAFEGYLGGLYPPEKSTCCLKVVQLVAENLREFSYNRMNHEACENMCYAASMSRILLTMGAGPGGRMSLHEAGTQIGGVTDCHHGRVIALLTLPIQRYNEPTVPERFGEMAAVMGVDTRGMTRMQAADKWFDEVERLLSDLDLQTGHLTEQIGLKKEDMEDIVTRSAARGTVGTPSDILTSDVAKVLMSTL